MHVLRRALVFILLLYAISETAHGVDITDVKPVWVLGCSVWCEVGVHVLQWHP